MAATPDSSAALDPSDVPASVEWIERLVRIDSTSAGSNLPLLKVIADHLRAHGVEVTLIPAPDQPDKANLLATIPAADGTRTGGVVISGHSDVVPVAGQQWTSDPFDPKFRDARLYGRGTADMKSWIAVAMAKLPDLVAAELSEPVHFAFTYDEEVGCIGGAQLVKDIAELGLSPRLCLVGEPTSMRVVRAHKGVNLVVVEFTGVAAHSSLPTHGVNAIEYAASMVHFVGQLAEVWRTEGPFDDGYLLPYSTASVNQIDGGTASNIVPEKCTVAFEFRNIAAVAAAEVFEAVRAHARQLEQQMQTHNQRASVTVTIESEVPGLESGPDGPAHQLAIACGAIDEQEKVTYATEAGQFAAAGIDTVVVGPGDIAQAHAADEFVSLDQIALCEQFFDRLIKELS